MPSITAPHGPIEYAVEGVGEPLVLINGLGSQLIRWSPAFRAALVDCGFQVIRFDNRDAGLSKGYGDEAPDLRAVARALRAGEPLELPYRIADLASDVVTLLDSLGIPKAHLLGMSMGGFIAQHLAADHPTHVASLTLIMSSSGNPALPPPSAEAQALLSRRSGDGVATRDALIDQAVLNAQVIASPAYPTDPGSFRLRAAAEIDRAYRPAGYVRQRAAIMADGDRRAMLSRIKTRTLVIHGKADPLVPHKAGEELARLITGATLRSIEGMGHEIPDQLAADIALACAANAGLAAR
jgi:pimeloyl-ACP methyl ester carboxylesterase